MCDNLLSTNAKNIAVEEEEEDDVVTFLTSANGTEVHVSLSTAATTLHVSNLSEKTCVNLLHLCKENTKS